MIPTVPNRFEPLPHQLEYLKACNTYSRVVHCWHRRAGKDLVDFVVTGIKMVHRVGNYWHVFPKYTQARKSIWEARTKEGIKYIDVVFPKEIIAKKNDQEMSIELINGSKWRAVGSDNIDALVGAGPVDVVMSEYSLQDPRAWVYIEPMLMENNGTARFNGTPRGENHFYDLIEMAKVNKKWFVDIKTVDDTGIITEEQINDIRAQGEDEDIIQQEYYCSFQAALEGSYYSKHMRDAAAEGRICNMVYDPGQPVYTAWDMGYGDYTAVWFWQFGGGNEIHIIDYFEDNQKEVSAYFKSVLDKPYTYGGHYMPHDANAKSRQTGLSDIEMAMQFGLKNVQQVEKLFPHPPNVQEGINAARGIMNRCWFDVDKCRDGINALKAYRKEWDEKKKRFRDKPLHDWASDGADAFRYLALAVKSGNRGGMPSGPIKYPHVRRA